MSIKRMMLLVEVARSGSISAAARQLHYTPSAISQQISQLESEVGHDLIRRNGRSTSLTDAGRIVIRHAERIERIHEAAHREVLALEGLQTGSLRLGTFPTFSQAMLPEVITSFKEKSPHVSIDVESGTREQLRLQLESGEIDIAFLWDYADQPLDVRAEEEAVQFATDPIVLVTPKGFREGARSLPVDELPRGERWISRGDDANRNLLARFIGGEVTAVGSPLQARTYDELQAFVASGLGLAVVPKSSMTTLRSELGIVNIETQVSRRLWFAYRRHARLSPAAAAMNGTLRSMAARNLAPRTT